MFNTTIVEVPTSFFIFPFSRCIFKNIILKLVFPRPVDVGALRIAGIGLLICYNAFVKVCYNIYIDINMHCPEMHCIGDIWATVVTA